jgi:tripartite-type tricarboxylate transporter receptor subunit TctC
VNYLYKPFAFGLLVAMFCLPGNAQIYPTKTIRLVVPYPAGGATDYVARLFGERLSKALGQPVMVDNKAGAARFLGGFVDRQN